MQSCPNAVFPGTPADSTVNALRPNKPRTQKYDDFLVNGTALSGPVTQIPGVGTTYGQRLNDDGRDTVRTHYTLITVPTSFIVISKPWTNAPVILKLRPSKNLCREQRSSAFSALCAHPSGHC